MHISPEERFIRPESLNDASRATRHPVYKQPSRVHALVQGAHINSYWTCNLKTKKRTFRSMRISVVNVLSQNILYIIYFTIYERRKLWLEKKLEKLFYILMQFNVSTIRCLKLEVVETIKWTRHVKGNYWGKRSGATLSSDELNTPCVNCLC